MKRREFITLLGGAAAWPLAGRAQQRRKPLTVGYLMSGGSTAWTSAFADRLRELGWIEGRTIAIEYRDVEARPERVAEAAVEFVRHEVDVIVTYGAAAAIARQATTTIPIIFTMAVDAVGMGLVASLSRPGGNVTGTSIQQAEIAGKRLGLLRDAVPHLRRLAVMFEGGDNAGVPEGSKAQDAAHTLGLEVAAHEIRRAEDIALIFGALNGQADALYIVENPLIAANITAITTLAINAQLPTILTTRFATEAGGLMSYGANFPILFRRAAEIVDKILRGVKPADIPVEQPTKFDLVINLKTAKALRLTIPEKLLALADEVIE